MIDWQDMVVLGLVFGSAVFLGRHLWRSATRVRGCGCGTPCKRGEKRTQAPISIGSNKR